MFLDPEQLGRGVRRAGAQPGQAVDRFLAARGADDIRLGRGALVGPDDAWTERFALAIHQERALHRAAEADDRDRAGRDARLLQQPSRALEDRRAASRRGLARPSSGVDKRSGRPRRSRRSALPVAASKSVALSPVVPRSWARRVIGWGIRAPIARMLLWPYHAPGCSSSQSDWASDISSDIWAWLQAHARWPGCRRAALRALGRACVGLADDVLRPRPLRRDSELMIL